MADQQTADVEIPQKNPLSRKLAKILETRLENDREMLESLKSLSFFFTDNNLTSRRNLRGNIERRSLDINREFVQAFQKVKEQLDAVHGDVKEMNECCDDMNQRLKAAKQQTRDLINQTTSLQSESQKIEFRSKVVESFLNKFQLKPEEVIILRGGRDSTLHPEFFSALARVKHIHTDCKVLLRTNQQTAGLEIMESMAMYQEASYERLYRWTQNECRAMTGDAIDASSQVMLAFNSLQDRQVLFRYSLDEYGAARRTAVVRMFLDALTRGGPNGTPRPIELSSHDSLRYIGDMLAWLHQATATEREHLTTLLKKCQNSDLKPHLQDVLGHLSEGLCRPLKTRVEQVLLAEPGAVLMYKITNLLKFYLNTVSQVIGSPSALLSTIEELCSLSLTMFFNSLNIHATKQLEKVELPPVDLSPTPPVHSSLQLLQDILSSHDSALVPVESRKQDMIRILGAIVDPLIQLCSVSASRLASVDMATYMINCLHIILSTLSLYEFTEERLEMLQAQMDAHVDTLVSEQTSQILQHTSLLTAHSIILKHSPDQGPLLKVDCMDSTTLKNAMAQFDVFLSKPDSFTLSQCTLLATSKLREKVKKNTAELLTQEYKKMYDAIVQPENKYTNYRSIVPRTPEQVAKLLL